MIRKSSFKYEFFLISTITFVMVLCFSGWSAWRTYTHQESVISQALDTQAGRIERTFTETVDYTAYLMNYLNEQIALNPKDLNYVNKLISSFRLDPEVNHTIPWNMFSWANAEMKIVVNSDKGILTEPADISGREYAPDTISRPNEISFGPSNYGKVSNLWVIPAGMGIKDKEGNYLGATIFGFNLKAFTSKVENAINKDGVFFGIMDIRSGQIIMESKGHPISQVHGIATHLLKLLDAGNSGILSKPTILSPQTPFISYSSISKYPYVVIVMYDTNLTNMEIWNAMTERIMEFALSGFLVISLFLLIYHRLVTPVTKLSQAAVMISQGESNVTLPQVRTYEIQNLAEQLEKILHYTDKLKHSQKKLHDANTLIRSILNYMVHELKTPLNQIIGFTELMLHSSKDPFTPKQTEYLSFVLEAGQHQFKLITTFLNMATFDEKALTLRETIFDIRDLITSRLGMVQQLALSREVKILTDYADGLPFVKGDATRLGQVLINLSSNGIKYNKAQGTLTVKVWVTAAGELAIQVADTGIGISEDNLKALFQLFHRITSEETKDIEGTGIGLVFCRESIELHEGRIEVESKVGSGSSFTIFLPKTRLVYEG